MNFNIPPLSSELNEALQIKLDHKTKPVGSLGQLERIAFQVGRIQKSLSPVLSKPMLVVVGGDHGITAEGVSPCPAEITWQQMLNFLRGGGGCSLFARQYGMEMKVVDAGCNYDFKPHPDLIDCKVRKGTRNFLYEPAMSREECEKSLQNGADLVAEIYKNGTNVVAFGEMGIGNTSPASVLMSKFCDIPIETCVGPGSGLTTEGVVNKTAVLKKAIENVVVSDHPVDILAAFGGLEIAFIAGGMLKAAELGMLIIVDGFIITSSLLAAQAINRNVLDYCLFSHQSKEGGHKLMVEFLKGDPILDLDLRLGEGTGAAIAYSIIEGAVAMLNEMTSFDEARVSDTTHIRMEEEK